jgi:hypothetical protein
VRADGGTFRVMCGLILSRVRNILDQIYRENQNTLCVYSNFFFQKFYRFLDNVEKYGTARQIAGDTTTRSRGDAICLQGN